MIDKIHLKFGRAPSCGPESIEATPIAVFVGPNNSGKSKVLTEINEYCRTGQKNANNAILESLEFAGFEEAVADNVVQKMIAAPMPGEHLHPGHSILGTRTARALTCN